MAVSSQPPQSPASRKIGRLAIAVIAVAAGYTGAWYYAAHAIKGGVSSFMQEQAKAGLSIECARTEINGFPFRFELFCTKPGVADLARGGSADAAALRTAAQVYSPSHIVWEMDGPLDATLATGEKLQINWQTLQSSLQLKTGGIDHSSMVAEGLQLVMPPGGTSGVFAARAAHGEAHIRQNGDDLDAALLFRDLALSLPAPGKADGVPLPVFSTSADLTLAKKAGVIDGRITGPDVLHPASGELRRVVVDFGEGRVATLSGPFDIDQQGLISGKIAVEAENFAAWQPLVTNALPDSADTVKTAMGAIKAMADAKGTVRVNLVIDKGQVLLGFIPLGIELQPV